MSNFQIHELNSVPVNRNSNIIHDTEVSTDEWDTGKDTAGAVADLASTNVAAPYDTTVTYAIGQYCLYEGNIYRCIAITTGAFDSTAWTQIVVTGEFRRVVELTSAQYTALSSAEKNNGTLYILTDEETTAADISYAAGVSVADKIDDLNGLVKIVFSGNISKTLTSGQTLNILGNEVIPAASMPSGYSVMGLLSSYCTNSNVRLFSYDTSAVGSTGAFCSLFNQTNTNQNVVLNFRIVFMKSAYVS